MSEMVERVARSLFRLKYPGKNPDEIECYAATEIGAPMRPIPGYRIFENWARNLMAEMREPTEAMLTRAESTSGNCIIDDHGRALYESSAQAWRDMIDGALAD